MHSVISSPKREWSRLRDTSSFRTLLDWRLAVAVATFAIAFVLTLYTTDAKRLRPNFRPVSDTSQFSAKYEMTDFFERTWLVLCRFLTESLRVHTIPGLTPNIISFTHLFIAIVSGVVAANGRLRTAAALFTVRSILDVLDGQVFRAQSGDGVSISQFKTNFGSLGRIVDGACDVAGTTALFVGCFYYFAFRAPQVVEQRCEMPLAHCLRPRVDSADDSSDALADESGSRDKERRGKDGGGQLVASWPTVMGIFLSLGVQMLARTHVWEFFVIEFTTLASSAWLHSPLGALALSLFAFSTSDALLGYITVALAVDGWAWPFFVALHTYGWLWLLAVTFGTYFVRELAVAEMTVA